MKRIAVFASGSGSNAEKIIRHFQDSPVARVVAVFTNNPKAGVIQRAHALHTPVEVFDRELWKDQASFLEKLDTYHPDIIVLAGFLWLVPPPVVQAFEGKILNIHPALLPSYGGKGFYGDHVHRAVLAARDIQSGITIHQVNEAFDDGDIVFQAACHVSSSDTVETLAARILELEHRFYPTVVEKYILARLT